MLKIIKKEGLFLILSCLLIVVLGFILYSKPLIDNNPVGIDFLGHATKVSYINEFGSPSWDLSWYCGAPFLKLYSPLVYYAAYIFGGPVFGINLMGILSIILSSIGVFFLIKFYTKRISASLMGALLFLSVLCTSYYYISTGNMAFLFGMCAIPLTLLFFEKTLENKYFFIPYLLLFLFAFLSHVFTALCLFLIIGLRLLFLIGFKPKLISYGLIFIGIPILLSGFWFFPFLEKSSNFVANSMGGDYIPTNIHLLGFENYIIWGEAAGKIGIPLFIFLLILVFSFKKILKDKTLFYLLCTSLAFYLLLEGILGKYYPSGYGPTRFIVPLSIFVCIFAGVGLGKLENIKLRKIFYLLFSIAIVFALIICYNQININYNNYSYFSNTSRYGFINELQNSSLGSSGGLFKNSFTNYRFGTNHFIFSETLTYAYPWISQTLGYHDQGILYPETLAKMMSVIWESNDTNETIYYMDSFAIKYFEVSEKSLGIDSKFNNSTYFKKIYSGPIAGYYFNLYEYKNAKSLIDVEDSKNNVLNYSYSRLSPDRIKVFYNFSGQEKIMLREFYHGSWRASDNNGNNIYINKTENNLMFLVPENGSKEITIYQSKTKLEYFGYLASLLGVILAILIIRYIKTFKT